MDNQLFKDKYKIKSIRLPDWDYSSNGAYYITICTKDREHYFGNIKNGQMILSKIGEVVEKFWMEIPLHYQNLTLDEFVIMPDHLHGILIIDNDDISIPVEAIHELPLQQPSQKSRRKMTIPLVIGRFKMQTTKSFHEIENTSEKLWQRDYFEHIIRNKIELNQKRKYIINNPSKWKVNLL